MLNSNIRALLQLFPIEGNFLVHYELYEVLYIYTSLY